MTKVLLTHFNSIWGVIINPASSNVYRHVISFDTPDEKDEFINSNLFKGEDYKELLKEQPDVSFAMITSTKASFRVNIADYKDETIYSMLNKDFAIVEEEGELRFYTVVGVRKGTIIEYTADLDIFFTYDIKAMFNDNDTMINRTHLNRFTKSTTNKYDLMFDFRERSPLQIPEPIGSVFNERVTVKEANTFYEYYDKDYFFDERNFKALINIWLNEMYWGVVHEKEKKWFDNSQIVGAESGPVVLPYKSSVCVTGGGQIGDWQVMGVFAKIGTQARTTMGVFDVFSNKGDSPTTLSMQLSPYCPIAKAYLNASIQLKVFGDPKDKRLTVEFIQSRSPLSSNNLPLISANQIHGIINVGIGHGVTNKPNKSHKRDMYYEPKLRAFPFASLDIINSFTEKFNIHQQLLYKPDEIIYSDATLTTQISTTPEIYKTISSIEEGIYKFNKYDKKHMVTLASFQFPLSTSAWESYIANNSVSAVTGQAQKIIGGVGKVGAGFAVGGPAGAVAGLGAGVLDAVDFYAKRADIQNQPDNYSKMGSGLAFIYQYASMRDRVIKSQLQDQDMKQVYDYLYKNGYEFNKLGNINKFIDTRYYFNYIKASGVFENIKLQLSGEIKQLINDTVATGVTIWHMRDIKDFKGIKNYEYENAELEYV